MMQITKRLQALSASPIAQVKHLADGLIRDGVQVFDFGAGDPDFATPDNIKEAARRAMAENKTKYTASRGILPLREAVADRYNAAYGTIFGPEHVVITAGAKQALFGVFMGLLGPGDEMLIPSPYWATYPSQAALAQACARIVPTSEDSGFHLSVDELNAKVTDRTKVICLNSPCNPTGSIIAGPALNAIAEWAASRSCAVIYDECYEAFVYSGRHENPVAEYPESVVSIGSVSKTYAMTGWRIGWAIGPEPLMSAVDRFQSQSASNPNTVAQWAALEALTGDQTAVEAMRTKYSERRERVLAVLKGIEGLSFVAPEGAFYVFPNVSAFLSDSMPDSVALARSLLEEAHVVVVPGSAFGAEGYVRLSYAVPDDILETGMNRLKSALRKK